LGEIAQMNNRNRSLATVTSRTQSAGLSSLALAFVLPHEHKPMRLPVVPATLTALLDTMTDDTYPVSDKEARRAFLCRDPAYPLWVERSCYGFANFLSGTFTLPARVNETLPLPIWDQQTTIINSPTLDGRIITSGTAADMFVLGDAPGTLAVFVPPNSQFCIWAGNTGGAPAGSSVRAEINYRVGGESFTSLLTMAPNGLGDYQFVGVAGSTSVGTGTIVEGIIPIGFCYLTALRTGHTTAPSGASASLFMGWSTSGTGSTAYTAPTGPATVFTPFAMPPEFNNSTLPYGRTRLNSSAALFTNVTAALSKEGTVLAARLKPAVVDPWNFTVSHINAVHPSLRYFGPLEKGLYTFTTPSGNVDDFSDCWATMPSVSTYNASAKPLFQWRDIGLYNAVVLSDLGSSSAGTQMAVSCYCHLEFETTSSLFSPGVSTMTLETLHAAEVALLSFGHFHENPMHWAALRAAALGALKVVGPMLAPYVQQAGTALLNRGVALLRGKQAGDRKMVQSQMVAPRKPAANLSRGKGEKAR
jgi:hypothetical protein